jgi:hypothetical protein
MTTKQKCEKLAKILETIAERLRQDSGAELWEKEEPTIQALVAQAQMFLKKAMDFESDDLPSTARRRKPKNMKADEEKDYKILNDWPEILQ